MLASSTQFGRKVFVSLCILCFAVFLSPKMVLVDGDTKGKNFCWLTKTVILYHTNPITNPNTNPSSQDIYHQMCYPLTINCSCIWLIFCYCHQYILSSVWLRFEWFEVCHLANAIVSICHYVSTCHHATCLSMSLMK